MSEKFHRGRAYYIREIEQQLGHLVSWVEIATRCGHMDLPTIAEDIICGLLNLMYGWNLINANTPEQPNFPGIDLKNEEQCIAVQVTAKNDLNKVKDMLTKFTQNNLDERFRTLILVEITNQEPTPGMKDKKESCFYGKRDIWNIPRLMRDIKSRNVDLLEEIAAYLDKEVGSLCRPPDEAPLKESSGPAKFLRTPVIIGAILVLLAVIAIGRWTDLQRQHWEEQNNILMKNGFIDPETEQAEDTFKLEVKRSEVGTITFQDSLKDISENAVDVSQKNNKKVWAWATKNGNLYDLYIAADGTIYAPDNADNLFREMVNLTAIYFNGAFSTKNTVSMNSMFNNCRNLKKVDVSFFETDQVTDMAGMFCNCAALTNLDVSKFDTSSVEKMYSMFYGCSGLTELELGKFDTSLVDNMQGMFYNCAKLKELDVSSFKTHSATSMRSMFSGCANLDELNVGGFDTSNVTDMYAMFNDVSRVTELEVGNFNTEKVTNMACMFRGCEGLTQLQLNSFNTGKVTDMSSMFSGCLRLEKIDLSDFNTWLVRDMSGMFTGCWSLAEVDLGSFNTWEVTNMSDMFRDCSRLTKLNLSNFVTNNVTDMSSMFSGCQDLESLTWSDMDKLHCVMILASDGLPYDQWVKSDTARVTDVSDMFYGCRNLTNLNIDDWDLSAVTDYTNFMSEGMTVNGRPWEELFS